MTRMIKKIRDDDERVLLSSSANSDEMACSQDRNTCQIDRTEHNLV
jgi:hypothetical protein